MIRRIPIILSFIMAASVPLAISQPQLDDDIISVIQKEHLAGLVIWVAEGGDINAVTTEGNTLLMLACKTGDLSAIDFLLLQKPDLNVQNKGGATALMVAAKYGHKSVVEQLLSYDADPAIRTHKGVTAAGIARVHQQKEVYKLLKDAELVARKQS